MHLVLPLFIFLGRNLCGQKLHICYSSSRRTIQTYYRIRSIRRRGYYLFQQSISCGFYSRVSIIRERRLFNPVKTLCKYTCTCTKSTGVSTDGTEDDEIHCLKEGGVADDTRESGKRYMANPTSLSLAVPSEADDVDPLPDSQLKSFTLINLKPSININPTTGL